MSSVGNALFEEQTGLVEPRHKEAIHDKTRAIGTDDHHFAKHLAILNHFVDGFLTGGFGWNDLNEAVLGRVVEEVQSNKAVSTTGGFGQSVDRKRGRVGGKDGAFSTRFVQGIEDGGFDIKVFEHGLDDQIGVLCRVFHAHHAGDSTLNRLNLSR